MISNIQSELQFIVLELRNYQNRIRVAMSGLPSDDICLQKKKGQKYYTSCKRTNNGCRVYLGKSTDPRVSGRLKYQVCNILHNRVDALLKALDNILSHYSLTIDLNQLELELPEKYKDFPRDLFQNLHLTDQKQLLPQTENHYQSYSENLKHQTLSGILVRSKSEQIIADRLFMNHIHFEYEPPFSVKQGPELHPDFKIFYATENRWIFIEHFGKISDSNYVNIMKKKINTYIDNDLLVGYNIFFTYDRPDGSLDIQTVDHLIQRFKN